MSSNALNSIPNEILADIIKLAVDYPSLMDRALRHRFATLRRVCRRWEAVAMTTPELWRALEVHSMAPRSLSHIHRWFRRGGDNDASYRLVAHGCKLKPAAQRALENGLASLIARYRWGELGLLYIPTSIISRAMAHTQNFDQTTRLELIPRDTLVANDVTDNSQFKLPALRVLYLVVYDLLKVQLPLNNLVVLHLRCIQILPSALGLALRQENLPFLREVVIEGFLALGMADVDPISDIFTNTSVTDFTLIGHFIFNGYITSLKNLSFPSLRLLRLADVTKDMDHEWAQTLLEQFIRRSAANVEVLSMEEASTASEFEHAEDVVRWVSAAQQDAPRLQHIHVADPRFFSFIRTPELLPLKALRTVVIIEPLISDRDYLTGIWDYFIARAFAHPDLPPVKIISHVGGLPTPKTKQTALRLKRIRQDLKDLVVIDEMESLRDYQGLKYGMYDPPHDQDSMLYSREWEKRNWRSWNLDTNLASSEEEGEGDDDDEDEPPTSDFDPDEADEE